MLDLILDILAEIADFFIDRWLHKGKKKKQRFQRKREKRQLDAIRWPNKS